MLMEDIKEEIQNINKKVDKMYYALMGSEITKDGGLIARIVKSETSIDILKDEIELLKNRNTKFEVYQRIMWSSLGGVVSMVFAYVINLLIK
jgi:hypothetical protein